MTQKKITIPDELIAELKASSGARNIKELSKKYNISIPVIQNNKQLLGINNGYKRKEVKKGKVFSWELFKQVDFIFQTI